MFGKGVTYGTTKDKKPSKVGLAEAAGKDAMMAGLIETGGAVIGGMMQESHQAKLDNFRSDQMAHMKNQACVLLI